MALHPDDHDWWLEEYGAAPPYSEPLEAVVDPAEGFSWPDRVMDRAVEKILIGGLIVVGLIVWAYGRLTG